MPLLLLYLWLAFGFTLHALLVGRIRGLANIADLGHETAPLERALFRDAGFIDGWFLAFVDPGDGTLAATDPTFRVGTATFLILVFGSLVSAGQACLLALLSIGARRYIGRKGRERLWFYHAPLPPLLLLWLSHVQFAYGGPNYNWFQIYIAAAAPVMLGFLLWMSAAVDKSVSPTDLVCLQRRATIVLPPAALARNLRGQRRRWPAAPPRLSAG